MCYYKSPCHLLNKNLRKKEVFAIKNFFTRDLFEFTVVKRKDRIQIWTYAEYYADVKKAARSFIKVEMALL